MPANSAEYQRNYRSLRKEEASLRKLTEGSLHTMLLEIKEELDSLRKLTEEIVRNLANLPLSKNLSSNSDSMSLKKEVRERGHSTRSGANGHDRGARLAYDWQPSPFDREFAIKHGCNPEHTAAVFRDYWHAATGSKAVKQDWSATWRNWIRREQKSSGDGPLAKPNGVTPYAPLRDPVEIARARGLRT